MTYPRLSWPDVMILCETDEEPAPGLALTHPRDPLFQVTEMSIDDFEGSDPLGLLETQQLIAELTAALEDGRTLPPVLIGRPGVGEPPELLDGYHRVKAHEAAGHKSVIAVVEIYDA